MASGFQYTLTNDEDSGISEAFPRSIQIASLPEPLYDPTLSDYNISDFNRSVSSNLNPNAVSFEPKQFHINEGLQTNCQPYHPYQYQCDELNGGLELQPIVEINQNFMPSLVFDSSVNNVTDLGLEVSGNSGRNAPAQRKNSHLRISELMKNQLESTSHEPEKSLSRSNSRRNRTNKDAREKHSPDDTGKRGFDNNDRRRVGRSSYYSEEINRSNEDNLDDFKPRREPRRSINSKNEEHRTVVREKSFRKRSERTPRTEPSDWKEEEDYTKYKPKRYSSMRGHRVSAEIVSPNEFPKYRDLKLERNDDRRETPIKRTSLDGLSSQRNIAGLFSDDSLRENAEFNEFVRENEEFLLEYSNNKDRRWAIRNFNKNITHRRVVDREMDLFQLPAKYSLAHCVSEDFRMSRGVAVTFRNTFGSTDELLEQCQTAGGLAVLNNGERFVYYLVTKRLSNHKPTYSDMWRSIALLRDHVRANSVRFLGIPTLGCGLDKLDWPVVQCIIEYLFRNVDVEIVCCKFRKAEDDVEQMSCSSIASNDDSFDRRLGNFEERIGVSTCTESLTNLESIRAVILCFGSSDGRATDEMRELDKKYNFLHAFKSKRKDLGSVLMYETGGHCICCCITMKYAGHKFDFVSFKRCIIEINRITESGGYTGLVMNYVSARRGFLLHNKIITMLTHFLENVNVYVYRGEQDNEI
ncbi:unnamed protein product [Phyllotreta striolata]|uniref:Macro domain-containing protein n=1 Tax=Phyllotreta striolata TaxID=444603 RepID=A0A9N9TXZ3_PHYSR|nr:unnamed protein product [Phyllotreta striolata]